MIYAYTSPLLPVELAHRYPSMLPSTSRGINHEATMATLGSRLPIGFSTPLLFSGERS